MSGAYKYRPQYTQNELGVRPLNEQPEQEHNSSMRNSSEGVRDMIEQAHNEQKLYVIEYDGQILVYRLRDGRAIVCITI
jgi:hypothetical protein